MVTVWPLAIVQARMGSTRLPGKVLLPLGGKPLVQHAWEKAVEAFGERNVVVAIPDTTENQPLRAAVEAFGGRVFAWNGDERDVLGRFYSCAHAYRWHPDSIIVRITPDDWRKDVSALRRVANGERLPVELGGEAFTLAMLDEAQKREDYGSSAGTNVIGAWVDPKPNPRREHITRALFNIAPPSAPEGCWTIDTMADYLEAKRIVEGVSSFDPSTWDAERGATV